MIWQQETPVVPAEATPIAPASEPVSVAATPEPADVSSQPVEAVSAPPAPVAGLGNSVLLDQPLCGFRNSPGFF